MNRREFLIGATAVITAASVGVGFKGEFAFEDAKLKWYETTFDVMGDRRSFGSRLIGAEPGIGVTYLDAEGVLHRTAIRYGVKNVTERVRIAAKAQLIKWLEKVVK